jgi:hypothetical protein
MNPEFGFLFPSDFLKNCISFYDERLVLSSTLHFVSRQRWDVKGRLKPEGSEAERFVLKEVEPLSSILKISQ